MPDTLVCELRVLAELAAVDDGIGILGVRAAGEVVADRLAKLAGDLLPDDELYALLHDTGIAHSYPAAIEIVAGSAEFADACSTADDTLAAREVCPWLPRSPAW